jgi:hypothetical protein
MRRTGSAIRKFQVSGERKFTSAGVVILSLALGSKVQQSRSGVFTSPSKARVVLAYRGQQVTVGILGQGYHKYVKSQAAA